MKNISYLLVILLSAVNLMAQTEDTTASPRIGTLAATSNAPVGQAAQDAPEVSLDSDEKSPISASFRRLSNSEYEYTVTNNSEEQYSVNLDLIAKDENGRVVRKVGSYLSLSAGKANTREFKVPSNTANVSIDIRNWTRKEKSVSAEELSAEIETKKNEIKALEAKLAEIITPSTDVK